MAPVLPWVRPGRWENSQGLLTRAISLLEVGKAVTSHALSLEEGYLVPAGVLDSLIPPKALSWVFNQISIANLYKWPLVSLIDNIFYDHFLCLASCLSMTEWAVKACHCNSRHINDSVLDARLGTIEWKRYQRLSTPTLSYSIPGGWPSCLYLKISNEEETKAVWPSLTARLF